MISAAIIGVSGFGRIHYQDLVREAEQGNLRIIGATVINQEQEPEKCARLRELGCALYCDHLEMLKQLEGAIDLCCIPTGIHLHAPMTIDAMRHRANVFVEKPAAATIQDVRRMQQVEQETGRFVAVGFQTIYARETLLMKQLILNGELGELQSISSCALWPRLDTYYSRNQWAGRLRRHGVWILDSPFNNAVSHQLNMICFLAGAELEQPAQLASVEAELYRAHEIESADTVSMRVRTAAGVPLLFHATHASEKLLNPEIVVRGSRGSLHWTFSTLTIRRSDGSAEEVACETGEPLRQTIMQRLRDRIEGREAFICSLDIAAAHTQAVNGAHESSRVHPVGAEYIRLEPCRDSVKTVISGVDEAVGRAQREEKLFSELGVPWARPAEQVVELREYEHFPQRQEVLTGI